MYRVVAALIFLATGLPSAIAKADDHDGPSLPAVAFASDIQPLFAKHCLLCHGPDEAEAGLRLDLPEHAYTTLDSDQQAIVPGDAEASELLRRVTTDDPHERMPPEGESLTADEIETLRRWIQQGAPYERHWAYRRVEAPALPAVQHDNWVRNPIDAFVLAKLERVGVSPSPEADRATLIKRVFYDLVGLPPTPQEVDDFVNDRSIDAYERLVDTLLDSEHFGERWGRHWLDMARYADSDGYEKDRPRPNAWRYRDWVIDAINQDMPLDQFTIEQLAGDLLEDASPMQQLATAFHRQTLTNTEGGVDQEEFRVEATFDRAETTGAVWMALTLSCARCHSHKYDQISHHEYYQLFAFFNNADEAEIDVPISETALARYQQQLAQHDAEVSELRQRYESALEKLQPQIEAWEQEMAATLSPSGALTFDRLKLLTAKASSGAMLSADDDGSVLVSGSVPDKDKYTLVFDAPKTALSAIRLETLTHESLAKQGPGRAPNGNFVLSQVRAYTSDDPDFKTHQQIELVAAQADHTQGKFSPEGAIDSADRTGWAISPQMGNDHALTLFLPEPLELQGKFLQIVLDQQYGGKHTIGRFRVTTTSEFDPLRAVPQLVADALGTAPQQRSEAQRRAIAEHVASLQPATARLAKQLQKLKENAPQPPLMSVPMLAAKPRTTQLLERGDFLQPANEITPGALAVLTEVHPLRSRNVGQPPDRLDLARWLADPDHPLTSRVAVNHIWAKLFGSGIVPTVNDFGVRGESPTHPELLQWLAWNFPRQMQWSRKTLIRTILTSATYRQASHHRPQLQTLDPTNRLLARQNRLRVEAEIVRDLHLAAGGLLSRKVGGPSVFPPLPPGVAELSYANNFKWVTSSDEDRYRRGLYTFFKRTSPHPTLMSFDCPDSNTTRLQREASNTPLQALVTLNNDVFTEAAQAMAYRVLNEAGDDDHQRLQYALRLCIVRTPDDEEVGRFHDLLQVAREHYQANAADAEALTSRHTASKTSLAENAAWVATLRMVMNVDEFIVRD